MIRVGIDASNLEHGGSSTHLVEILANGEPGEHGIGRVVVWGPRRVLDKLPQRPWLDLVHVPALDGSRIARLGWQRELSARARAGCDVLFVPGQVYLGSFRPFVTMSRNMLPFDPAERARYRFSRGGVRLFFLRRVQLRTFRRAQGMIFLTDLARDVVVRDAGGLPGRVRVIPHGVSELFRQPPRAQRAFASYSADSPFRWLYVSAVEPYKHQPAVAQAAVALRERGLPVAVDFIGNPVVPGTVEAMRAIMARHDPEGRYLRYHGPVPYVSMKAWHSSADAALFASSCENMPNTLVEYMAAGLPIASSDRGIMPRVLGDAGVLLDPESPESIADAMERLMRDESLRASLAQRAYERAQRYSWRRCADETFAFLAEVAR
jgi:glycosyltransferase involved in cell wall biosynthesis